MRPIIRPGVLSTLISCALVFHLSSMATDTTQIANQNTFKEMSQFSRKMMRELVKENETANRCISGASIHHALGVAYMGAPENSDTARSMAKTLGLTEISREKIASGYGHMVSKLTFEHKEVPEGESRMKNPPFEVIVANRVLAFHGGTIKDEFRVLAGKMGASAATIPTTVPDAQILRDSDSWVSMITHTRIPTILPGIQADDRMVLLNAIYFKGSWAKPFNQFGTAESPFFLASGKETTVQMMSANGSYHYLADAEGQIVELPFATARMADQQPRFSMFIVLPDKNKNIMDAIANFDVNRLEAVEKTLIREGSIRLPRFKIETDINVTDVLTRMGMAKAFSPNADFSIMGNGALSISKVLHKTFIDVSEKGVEAAAATAVIMSMMGSAYYDRPAPFYFDADHPFLFFIKDKELNVVLFEGVVMNPNLR